MSDTKKIHEDARFFEKKTDPKFTKKVDGFGAKPGFTNIDAYYLIQEATKEFGLYGSGFGLKETRYEKLHLEDGTILLELHAIFFFGTDGLFPISNSDKLYYTTAKGKKVLDTELYKKLETNTISKALSRIGFGSDVFMGKFEDALYRNEATGESAISLEQVQQLTPIITATKTDMTAFNKAFAISKLSDLKQEDFQKALAQLKAKLAKQNEDNK